MSHDIYCMPTACAHAIISIRRMRYHVQLCYSTSQCVCNKSVQTSTVLISRYYRYKSNTCSRVIAIHRKTNSNYHTFELTITVNEDYFKWPLYMLEEQIRLLFRRCNLCTTGTVWPYEEDETSALQVALA